MPPRNRESNRLHDITVSFVHATDKATLYNDGMRQIWVPKSITGDDGIVQIEENKDGTYTLTAPEWWMQDRNLI